MVDPDDIRRVDAVFPDGQDAFALVPLKFR